LAEDLGPWRWETLAPILAAVIATVATRVVAVAGLSSLLLLSMPAGVQGVARVTVVTKAAMY
jgi:hypothetical protein